MVLVTGCEIIMLFLYHTNVEFGEDVTETFKVNVAFTRIGPSTRFCWKCGKPNRTSKWNNIIWFSTYSNRT